MRSWSCRSLTVPVGFLLVLVLNAASSSEIPPSLSLRDPNYVKPSKYTGLGWFWSDDWDDRKASHVRTKLRQVMGAMGLKLNAMLMQLEEALEYRSGNVAIWAYGSQDRFYQSIKEDAGRFIMRMIVDICEAWELKARLGKGLRSLRDQLAAEVVALIDFEQLGVVLRSIVEQAGYRQWDVEAMLRRLRTELVGALASDMLFQGCR